MVTILEQISAIGNTISANECLENLYKLFPVLQNVEEAEFLNRAIKSLISLMEGRHYDVRRIYYLFDIDDKIFEGYLKEVQVEIREYIKSFIILQFDLGKLKKFYDQDINLNEPFSQITLN